MKRIVNYCLIICFLVTAIRSLAHPAWGIAVDKYRNIYFADIVHNGRGTVWKLTNRGELIALMKDFHSHNVSLDKEGNLYTAHGEDNHILVKISPEGQIDTLIETDDLETFFGGNCTVSPSGRIYFGIRHYIHRYDKGTVTRASDHYLEWNQSVFVDEDENIFAADIDGSGDLYGIYPNGSAELLATGLISTLKRPRDKHSDVILGITKGCDNLLYLAETAGKRIIRILPGGDAETFYRPDDGWVPTAVDFFAGDAYIMEYSEDYSAGPRITHISESGEKSVLFNYSDPQRGEVTSRKVHPQILYWGLLPIILISILLLILRRRVSD